jgi:hypothetical protein
MLSTRPKNDTLNQLRLAMSQIQAGPTSLEDCCSTFHNNLFKYITSLDLGDAHMGLLELKNSTASQYDEKSRRKLQKENQLETQDEINIKLTLELHALIATIGAYLTKLHQHQLGNMSLEQVGGYASTSLKEYGQLRLDYAKYLMRGKQGKPERIARAQKECDRALMLNARLGLNLPSPANAAEIARYREELSTLLIESDNGAGQIEQPEDNLTKKKLKRIRQSVNQIENNCKKTDVKIVNLMSAIQALETKKTELLGIEAIPIFHPPIQDLQLRIEALQANITKMIEAIKAEKVRATERTKEIQRAKMEAEAEASRAAEKAKEAKALKKTEAKHARRAATAELTQVRGSSSGSDTEGGSRDDLSAVSEITNPSLLEARGSISADETTNASDTTYDSQHPKGYPLWTENYFLKKIIAELADAFKKFKCDAFLFGSANYKTHPNDLDILVRNTDALTLYKLIEYLEEKGATIENDYWKDGRHVININFFGRKIDFILSDDNIIEHARKIDFTVSAAYYNLRDQSFHFPCDKSISDFFNRTLALISDEPTEMLSNHPDVILRAVRALATTDFIPCRNSLILAIKKIFMDNNPFEQMNPNKLYREMNLLFCSGFASQSLSILIDELGIFNQLFARLNELNPQARRNTYNFVKQVGYEMDSVFHHNLHSFPQNILPTFHPSLFYAAVHACFPIDPEMGYPRSHPPITLENHTPELAVFNQRYLARHLGLLTPNTLQRTSAAYVEPREQLMTGGANNYFNKKPDAPKSTKLNPNAAAWPS